MNIPAPTLNRYGCFFISKNITIKEKYNTNPTYTPICKDIQSLKKDKHRYSLYLILQLKFIELFLFSL